MTVFVVQGHIWYDMIWYDMIWYDKYNEMLQSFPKHGCIVVDNILNLSTIAYLHLLDQQIVSQFQRILFVY